MWRMWCAPKNASKWQVGFNSAFKALISVTRQWEMSKFFSYLIICTIGLKKLRQFCVADGFTHLDHLLRVFALCDKCRHVSKNKHVPLI
jgi:hypothetical protein